MADVQTTLSLSTADGPPVAGWAAPAPDLAPLAWVLDALRASLDGAVQSLRLAAQGPEGGTASGPLQHRASRALQQARGVLEMVGMGAVAPLLRSAQAVVQQGIDRSEPCSAAAISTLEQACLALVDYLEAVLAGQPVSPVALFLPYREVQALAGNARVQPTDLWPLDRARHRPPALGLEPPASASPLPCGPEVRARLDAAVLDLVRTGDAEAAGRLCATCLGLAVSQTAPAVRSFWVLCAGFFEALATGLVPVDVYVKRVASRVLMQYTPLAQGDPEIPDRLWQDLLFYCAQAPVPGPDTGPQAALQPALQAVRQAFALGPHRPVDYGVASFGRFAPALLAQARQWIAVLAEQWSALARGEAGPARSGLPPWEPLGEALSALHPGGDRLVQALGRAVDRSVQSGEPPSPALALEGATVMLYLQSHLQALEWHEAPLAQRAAHLSERLDAVAAGAEPEPLADWVAALYRQVSDRQTRAALVRELRGTLDTIENALDAFVRNPLDPAVLGPALAPVAQMQGVLSVLGLDQPALALAHLRASVERLRAQAVPASQQASTIDTLGHNLAALRFLLDLLRYQEALAHELLVFDPALGELRTVTAQERRRLRAATQAGALPAVAAGLRDAAWAEPVQAPDAAVPAPGSTPLDETDQALLHLFLDEAREVVVDGMSAIAVLEEGVSRADEPAQLRRAFHTLKGSARMVGLDDFGEAAWAFEQLLQPLTDTGQPLPVGLLVLCADALHALNHWAENLAAGRPGGWPAALFREAAQALSTEGRPVRLVKPEACSPPGEEHSPAPAEAPALPAAGGPGTGALRVSQPLWDVFQDEAGAWSRGLLETLQDWSLQRGVPLPDLAVRLAHSLAGSSATVGCLGLSQLARALEQALQHLRPGSAATEAEARVQLPLLVAAAEELRRLLPPSAVGVHPEPDPQRLAALRQISLGVPEDPGLAEDPLDADLDAVDAPDPDLFPVFQEEAAELLPRLGTALRQWVAHPAAAEPRAQALRALHTLKGSARLAGAMRLGERAHRLESLAGLNALALEPLLAHFDHLQAHCEALRAPVEPPAGAVGPPGPGGATLASLPASGPASAWPGAGNPPAARGGVPPSVRVRAQWLDRLVDQAGEVMVSRSRLETHLGQFRGALTDLAGDLDRLRQQLRELDLHGESQLPSRDAAAPGAAPGFDPLEFDRFTRVQELTRMMAESVDDLTAVQHQMQATLKSAEDEGLVHGRQARALQRDLLRTRMVEFESLAERLYAVVRQSAKATGKPIRLDITGGALELDRGVLERMAPAFEHVLRNAVAHGIEAAHVRQAAGKPALGHIAVEVRQDGSEVRVALRDDGAGLDLPRIHAKALALGWVAEDTPLDAAEAADLICLPGFSTAAEVTGLAGRGIGLDVVRSEVHALGGRVEVASEAGQGSVFQLVFPLTTAVTQVVMLRAGPLTLGVPANLVEGVHRLPVAAAEQALSHAEVEVGAERLPFFRASALLQLPAVPAPGAGRYRPWVVVRSGPQRIALLVDEVLGHQELVVKPLGPQLARLPGLAGMSVLASGAVVLIYNPVVLASTYGAQSRAAEPQREAPAPLPGGAGADAGGAAAPLVLVVDDSITVRRVTQRLLRREGYRVALAADGLQALECLQQERPAVVLSDIEMPRMDGFELVRHLRAEAAWQGLPVIMITSRMAEKHRDHAMQLGANHYLGKPYPDEELLRLVRHYARMHGEAAA
ncbi:MAG: Hpt domain-containing protein [Burkholderiaceae bacterium]|nr:Hpt domain-containing protein [Burkholderiaceae bacterium]